MYPLDAAQTLDLRRRTTGYRRRSRGASVFFATCHPPAQALIGGGWCSTCMAEHSPLHCRPHTASGLVFPGFGASDRHAEMDEPAARPVALGDSVAATIQLERAVTIFVTTTERRAFR